MASTLSAPSISLSPPAWVRPYLGLSYSEYDCWQLCGHVLKLEARVDLPTFEEDYETSTDLMLWAKRIRGQVDEIVQRERSQWRKFQDPACFDIALYRGGGAGWHTMLVIGGGWALNTNLKRGSHTILLRDSSWIQRLDGYYRHERLIRS